MSWFPKGRLMGSYPWVGWEQSESLGEYLELRLCQALGLVLEI